VRMIMMGLWFTDKPPFHTVYLHGLVRDAQGRKISKTLGNTIDPLELTDKFGADPLRFTLVTSGTPGNDVNLDTSRVEGNWKFVNKIWQMANFITQNLEGDLPLGVPDAAALDLPSRWILSRLNNLIDNVQHLFDIHLYGEGGRQIYEFLWSEFADWYIEISKHALYSTDEKAKESTRRVLVHVLETSLRLLHPFMPFVTEEIWQHIPHEGQALIIARWPQANQAYLDENAESEMNILMDIVRGVRNARAEYDVDPGRRIQAIIAPGSHRSMIAAHNYVFARLCNVSEINMLEEGASAPGEAASVVVSDVTVYLPLAGLVDVAAECERLMKERDKINQAMARTQGMLSNENFVSRANPKVVEVERARLAELQASATQINERITALCGG